MSDSHDVAAALRDGTVHTFQVALTDGVGERLITTVTVTLGAVTGPADGNGYAPVAYRLEISHTGEVYEGLDYLVMASDPHGVAVAHSLVHVAGSEHGDAYLCEWVLSLTGPCRWSVACANKATTTVRTAALGDVPACQGCAELVARIDAP